MDSYKYSQGDLLTSPNTYFYTEYEGIRFFAKWKESRRPFLEYKNGQDNSESILGNTKLYKKRDINDFKNSKVIDCSELLDTLLFELNSKNSELGTVYVYIDKLVKRFELFKRIHNQYSQSFKAVDKKQYHNYGLYIKTAMIFEYAFQATQNLSYLNALLKIIDTLLSIGDELNISHKAELAEIIRKEQEHILKLAKKNGVFYEHT